jgi:hypothetical protein
MELSSSWECNTPTAVRKFPAFYGNWNFITMFTKADHFSLSWSKLFQSSTSQHIDLKLISILFSHLLLVLLGYLFPLEFPTKLLHGFLFSLIPTTFICLSSRLGHPNSICWRVQIIKFLAEQFAPFSCHFFPPWPPTPPSAPYSRKLSPASCVRPSILETDFFVPVDLSKS